MNENAVAIVLLVGFVSLIGLATRLILPKLNPSLLEKNFPWSLGDVAKRN